MTRLGVVAGLVGVLGFMTAAACSAGDSKSSNLEDDGAGANIGAGAGSANGGSGPGVGGFSNTGGMGTGGTEACQEIDVEAQPLLDAADIIFVIDTSGSMIQEMGFVQQNLNAFSQQIVASGVDVRVIMLAEAPQCPFGVCIVPGICIDPPLGAGGCPAVDDDNPAGGYYHPASEISSTDSLTQIVDLYPSYGGDLREGTHKYVVIVTDDNASAPSIDDAQTFMNTFTALDPTKLTSVKVHSIYCFDDSGPCADTGTVYQDLVNMTGGIHGNLALQDFQPIFNDMAQQVVQDAGVPCQYPIPEPPDGEELDPNKVNVEFSDGNGGTHEILQVGSFAACDPVQGGWYYNDPNMPTVIHMCPATCDFVSTEEGGAMDIKFGCATKVLQPE